jgi:hypothetical protein
VGRQPAGQRCRLLVNIEQIEIGPEAEDQTKTLWLKNGIPSASHSNKQFFKHDYSTPTSDDVRQAMAPLLVENLGKWTLFMQAGRATQTAQVPNGATIYQTLKQIAKENGELPPSHQRKRHRCARALDPRAAIQRYRTHHPNPTDHSAGWTPTRPSSASAVATPSSRRHHRRQGGDDG